MNALEKRLIRKCAQYRVVQNQPGLVVLSLPLFRMLPAPMRPYARYLAQAYRCLPGVEEASFSVESARLTVRCDPARLTGQQVLDWWDVILQEGGAMLDDPESTKNATEQGLAEKLLQRLHARGQEQTK